MCLALHNPTGRHSRHQYRDAQYRLLGIGITCPTCMRPESVPSCLACHRHKNQQQQQPCRTGLRAARCLSLAHAMHGFPVDKGRPQHPKPVPRLPTCHQVHVVPRRAAVEHGHARHVLQRPRVRSAPWVAVRVAAEDGNYLQCQGGNVGNQGLAKRLAMVWPYVRVPRRVCLHGPTSQRMERRHHQKQAVP